MLFSSEEIQELLKLIEFHHVYFGAQFLGKDPLDPEDMEILDQFGVDISGMPENSFIETAYKFGIISRALPEIETKKLTYNDFKKWIRKGGYIPLSEQEQLSVKYLKRKSFKHLKNLGANVASDVENLLLDQDNKRRNQVEKIIKKELSRGTANRNSFQEIMLNLGHKTDDWRRDWGRIVETELHNAQEEGRADDILRNSSELDPQVYKQVYSQACRHCVKAYLTNGLGSKPIVFRLSQIRDNGTNIGKKTSDWKPVISSMHPWCRCTLHELPNGFIWNSELNMFVPPKDKYIPKVERKSKVKITIGNKDYYV